MKLQYNLNDVKELETPDGYAVIFLSSVAPSAPPRLLQDLLTLVDTCQPDFLHRAFWRAFN